MKILGISAYYHDSAAALVCHGDIVAAAQQERFSRKKHDARFSSDAIAYCLSEGKISLRDLDGIAFYDKPFVKFERILETYIAFAPRGFRSFVSAMPVWLKEKLFLKETLKKEFSILGHLSEKELPRLFFAEHHQSHAASSFFPSPFEKAAILCLDGVGEWPTTTAWLGRENALEPLWDIRFPHSLGLLYSAFTFYTGFKVNSAEYKVMGLAPYGEPVYVNTILDHLIDLKPDGTFRLNMEYFNYCTGLTMINQKFHNLFGGPPRRLETEVTQKEMNIARSIQEVTEEIVLRLAQTLYRDTGETNLCLAGGVALNCVANGKIFKKGLFKKIWIQPAAGDAGGALGAALALWYQHHRSSRLPRVGDDMKGAFLGPSFSEREIETALRSYGAVYRRLDDENLYETVARFLAEENVVGWFQGRMEFGPRALGARSIIGDARSSKMQAVMNFKIKHRESFRPFAPAVLRERVSDYFELETDSPYMLLVADVKEERRKRLQEKDGRLWGIDLLNAPKSDIPAVTHVDYSARVQTVHENTNPRFYHLLKAFEKLTGYAVLVNTSFNVRGEPMVCTPQDAYRCFMRTEMDYLVIKNYVLNKADQQKWQEGLSWRESLELD